MIEFKVIIVEDVPLEHSYDVLLVSLSPISSSSAQA